MPLSIKDSVIVTGSKLIKNDYYIDYFKKKGEDIEDFLVHTLGKNERYHCDENENTLTMGVKAVEKLLNRNDVQGKDIDLIIFCSQYPEFTMPTQACMIHHHIKGKEKCVTLDINVNCLGMLRGLDIINRYFKDKNGDIKTALLIGSDYMSMHTDCDDIVSSTCFSDGACAMLLEYTDEKDRGIIGSADRTLSDEVYGCFFPACGLSHIDHCVGKDVKTAWTNPDTLPVVYAMSDALNEVLDKHNLSVDDIDWFCGSQFSLAFFKGIRKHCNIPREKEIYVGDKYGYTGTSSPFFSFTQGLIDGKIKKGDLVFLTTVGVGHTLCSMLVRM